MHNFNEKDKEMNLPVWKTPKYEESKEKAIKLLDSPEYKDVLTDGDFWILMNKTKSGDKMCYTGLIISHNACVKINDKLSEDKKFNQKYCSDPIKDERGMHLIYRDERDGMLEVGEVSSSNCKNEYPYAMLIKRTFDRVVLKKSGIAQWGIYSDSEAEEFKEPLEAKEEPKEEPKEEVKEKIKKTTWSRMVREFSKDELKAMFDECGVQKASEMTEEYALSKLAEKVKNAQEPSEDFY